MESIMKNQPIINIGCLGSVSDGKSTLVAKLTGINTQRHSQERGRNITVKQGYANMKIWNDDHEYHTTNSNFTSFTNPVGDECNLVNHVSFVDCPGHQELIETMLSSVSLMDGAIIIVAVDKNPAQKPQLIQHLAAAKLGKLNKIIVCMNKIDTIKKEVLMQRKQELDELLLQFNIVPYAVIPTCFNKKIGLNHVVNAVMKLFNPNEYVNKLNEKPIFRITRTFDVNKPGKQWDEVIGGVFGGSLERGSLKIGDELEIRPGNVSRKDGKTIFRPIKTQVLSIESDSIKLDKIIPGGLICIGTDCDPYYFKNDGLSKNRALQNKAKPATNTGTDEKAKEKSVKDPNASDGLVGNIVGIPGFMPSVYDQLIMDVTMVKTFGFDWDAKVNDEIILQIGTRVCDGVVKSIDGTKFTIKTSKPVCICDDQHVIICTKINKILRIVAEGTFSYSENPDKLIE